MTRKSFIEKALSWWTAVITTPILYGIVQYATKGRNAVQSPSEVVAGIPNRMTPGDVKTIREGGRTFFLAVSNSGEMKAFSASCSHLGCIVEYLREDHQFRCNCHGSRFDLDGNPLTGPADRPLDPYRVEVRDDNVIVTVF